MGESTGEIDLNRILVAHDFSTHSELAFKYGVSLAQEYQAELHLLHVLSKEERDQPEVAWAQAGSESGYKNAALQLQAAIPKEAFLWCKIVNAVNCGNAYQEVLTMRRSTTSTSSAWALAVRALFSVYSSVQTPIAFYDKRPVRSGRASDKRLSDSINKVRKIGIGESCH